ncbi:hypothetical protein CRV24_006369 [Beauveria bassiana]|nr:hypothetical protein CRV24_006369 [Beauveria bassiana]KAH8715469.1 hypothetical protein HC256_004288 [Beauveria bassiana]
MGDIAQAYQTVMLAKASAVGKLNVPSCVQAYKGRKTNLYTLSHNQAHHPQKFSLRMMPHNKTDQSPTQGDGATTAIASIEPPAHEVPSVGVVYLHEVPVGEVLNLSDLERKDVERSTAEKNKSEDAGGGMSKN